MIAEFTVTAPAALRMRKALSPVVQETYDAWADLSSPLSNWEGQAACALEAAYAEGSSDGWDGYGARAVSLGVKYRAEAFLDALPSGIPVPAIEPDPDGEISFEWYVGPRQVFSVSVGEGCEIAYAGLFGRNRTHGTEYFMDELPAAVMTNLRRLYGLE